MSLTPRAICRFILPLLFLLAGCAYYNTFYNARKTYNEGLREKAQGSSAQAKAKFDKAIEKSAMVIKSWPRSSWVDDALFLIGMSYYEESYYTKAIQQFDELSLAFPNSRLAPRAQLYRGLSLLADKQFGTAKVVLDGVKARHPKLADAATFYLARSFVEREEQRTAVDSLTRFVERFPRSRYRREALRLLAKTEFALGDYAEAEKTYADYARTTDEPKERARARLEIAAARFKQGKYQETIDEVSDLLGRYQEFDDEANLLIGSALAETGRNADAVAAWLKVRGYSDYGAEAAYRIGRHYEVGESLGAARAYYDTAKTRRLDSDYGVLAVKRLALLDAYTRRESDTLDPAQAAFKLAEAHNLSLADYDRALDLYQQVYDSFPESEWAPKALFAKAWITRSVKHDTGSALPLLKQVIAQYPETEYADEARRVLGMPVPKRARKVEPRAESLAARPDTARPTARETAALTKPAEEPEVAEEREPGMFPPGARGADMERMRERLDETTGLPSLAPRVADTKVPRKQGSVPPQLPKVEGRLAMVHFDTDRADIRRTDTDSLELALTWLRANPGSKVTAVGYCDPRASEQYNLALGFRRSQAAKGYLVTAGIPADRIDVRSEGESGLLSSKPDEYWMDRRVEFEVR